MKYDKIFHIINQRFTNKYDIIEIRKDININIKIKLSIVNSKQQIMLVVPEFIREILLINKKYKTKKY